ncbi:TPA: restriction endonuclease [Serratia fonticola]
MKILSTSSLPKKSTKLYAMLRALRTSLFSTKILGKSGCNHQIGVYWEFEMMGVRHCAAIECKKYSSVISVGKVRDFFGVLHDISNINGIFVTKVGYQSGAQKFANYYGITLKEPRFPTEKDWEGRVKDITLTITAFFTTIKERKIDLDLDWLFANTDFKEDDKMSFSGMTDEIKIVGSDGETITTFHDLENALPQNIEGINKVVEKEFDNAFIITGLGDRFKINGIRYLYDVTSHSQTSICEGNAIARAILKDVGSGAIKFFDQSGTARDVCDS